MKIPFISGEGPDGYLPVNLYFTPRKIHGRDALVGRPGLSQWIQPGTGEVRGFTAMRENLYAAIGDTIYRINTAGAYSTLGTVSSTTGNLWIENNGSQVAIVENNKCYVWDGSTLSEASDLPFSPGSLAYEGSRFVSHDVNSEHWYESESFDGDDWNGLEYAVTVVRPDYLNGLYASNGNIYAMGLKSGEVYYNSGGSTFSFSKVPGGNIPCGSIAENSPVEFMGSLFLLNEHRVFVQVSTQPARISNEHIDRFVGAMSHIVDARGFCFTMGGHTFAVWTFPTEDKTYVYDLTTRLWYEWRTGNGRWRPNCYINFAGKHLVGDYSNGKIYELSDTTYSDDGDEITRQRTCPLPKDATGNFIVSRFEIKGETGVGINTGQGSDPQICLEYSWDKGKNWSDEIWTDYGAVGDYTAEAVWNRLGTFEDFTTRITMTDPVKTIWTGAHINDGR